MGSQPLESFMVPGGNYGYTGAAMDAITALENTLAVTLFDESGSTRHYATEMEKVVKEIVKSLRFCPRADNLVYAHYHFDSNFREVLGFTPLAQVNESMFDNCWAGGGRTTLYDSCDRVIRSIGDYGRQLAEKRYQVNGFFCCLTDGMDWGSQLQAPDVKVAFEEVMQAEALESVMSILIGVNDDPDVQNDLKAFADVAGFSQYIAAKNADAQTLAKIGGFISKSIQAQSQSLGTGAQSASLTF